jgi:hypothetical protein
MIVVRCRTIRKRDLFQLGVEPRPGLVVHRPEYVAGVVLRLLRTGEDTFDIPRGPERPNIARIPA